KDIEWVEITPDKNNDWINQRDERYNSFVPFIDNENKSKGVYKDQYIGVSSARDVWTSGFSRENTRLNVHRMIENYNSEILRLKEVKDKNKRLSMVDKSEDHIKWTRGLTNAFSKNEKLEISDENMIVYLHRPFTKKWLYYDKSVVEYMTRYQHIYNDMGNVLYIQGQGTNK